MKLGMNCRPMNRRNGSSLLKKSKKKATCRDCFLSWKNLNNSKEKSRNKLEKKTPKYSN